MRDSRENFLHNLEQLEAEDSKVTSLLVDYYGITSRDIARLAKAISSHKYLTALCFSETPLTDEDLNCLEQAIVSNTRLTKIGFTENDLTPSGANIIAKMLAKCSNFKMLTLTCNEKITDTGTAAILEALQYHPNLTSLHIVNDIDRTSLLVIENLLVTNSSLKKLTIPRNPKVSSSGGTLLGNALLNNNVLTCLSVSNCNLGSEGVYSICSALLDNKVLTDLDLSNNEIRDQDTEVISKLLFNNSTLERINLDFNKITDLGCQRLAIGLQQNTSLLFFYLNYNDFKYPGLKSILSSLQINQSLTYLGIKSRDNSLTYLGIESRDNYSPDYAAAALIADSLQYNNSLTRLDFSGYKISTDGIKLIEEAMQYNSALTFLSDIEPTHELKTELSCRELRYYKTREKVNAIIPLIFLIFYMKEDNLLNSMPIEIIFLIAEQLVLSCYGNNSQPFHGVAKPYLFNLHNPDNFLLVIGGIKYSKCLKHNDVEECGNEIGWNFINS